MTFLFPLAVVERLISRSLSPGHSYIKKPSRPINRILAAIFALEGKAMQRMRLPFGLSLIARGDA
jgi:hypothetical protein